MWSIITFICFGAFIGLVARLLKPGPQNISALQTVLAGVGGALVGGIAATMLHTGTLKDMDLLGTIISVVVAIVLVGALEARGKASS